MSCRIEEVGRHESHVDILAIAVHNLDIYYTVYLAYTCVQIYYKSFNVSA